MTSTFGGRLQEDSQKLQHVAQLGRHQRLLGLHPLHHQLLGPAPGRPHPRQRPRPLERPRHGLTPVALYQWGWR